MQTSFGTRGTDTGQLYNQRQAYLSSDQLTTYVADTGNNRVSIWTRATTSATWAYSSSFGSSGSGAGYLNSPWGIAISSNNLECILAEEVNNRISIWTRPDITSSWSYSSTFGTFGTGSSNFHSPRGICLSADDLTLYVADKTNNRVSIWTRSIVGGTWTASTTITGFNVPNDLTLSHDELTLYVADNANNRIAVYTRATTSSPWSSSLTFGTSATILYPSSVAVTASQLRAYVTGTTQHRVVIFGRATTSSSWAYVTHLSIPSSNPADIFLTPDESRFYVVEQNLGKVSVWSAT